MIYQSPKAGSRIAKPARKPLHLIFQPAKDKNPPDPPSKRWRYSKIDKIMAHGDAKLLTALSFHMR
jgi:hypothetical protein